MADGSTRPNAGKTFLLDAVDVHDSDTDNIDSWQREGEPADDWVFVGVIDTGASLPLSSESCEERTFGRYFYSVMASPFRPFPSPHQPGSTVQPFRDWQESHGASVVSRSDGHLIGMFVFENGKGRIVPVQLPPK